MPMHPVADEPLPESIRSNAGSQLRADVRRVGDLLGRTLVRQEGQDLLDLVEQVRGLTKQAQEAEPAESRRRPPTRSRPSSPACPSPRPLLWCAPSPSTSTWPMRQSRSNVYVPCEADLPGRVAGPDRGRSRRRARSRATGRRAFPDLDIRPVFTAHPTEASRRSVLTKLRRSAICSGRRPNRTRTRGSGRIASWPNSST